MSGSEDDADEACHEVYLWFGYVVYLCQELETSLVTYRKSAKDSGR